MNSIYVIILCVSLFMLVKSIMQWCVKEIKENEEHHRKIQELQDRAERTTTTKELVPIAKEVIDLLRNEKFSKANVTSITNLKNYILDKIDNK